MIITKTTLQNILNELHQQDIVNDLELTVDEKIECDVKYQMVKKDMKINIEITIKDF